MAKLTNETNARRVPGKARRIDPFDAFRAANTKNESRSKAYHKAVAA